MQYCYLECMSSQNFCVLNNSKMWIVVCMWQKVLLLMTCDPLLQAGVQAHFVAIICIVYVLEFNHMWTQILLDDGKVLHPDEGVKCLMYLFSSRNKFYINKILFVLACVFLVLLFPNILPMFLFVCLQFYLQDTKSSNGTFINSQRLSRGSEESPPCEIMSGDIIQFGVDVTENTRKGKGMDHFWFLFKYIYLEHLTAIQSLKLNVIPIVR